MGEDLNIQRPIDKILQKKIEIKKISFTMVDLLFVFALWIFALVVRIKLYPALSSDYLGCLEPWMGNVKTLGVKAFLAGNYTNYTSPYLYLMCLVSGFENILYSLKTISVIFDYVAGVAIFAIIYELSKSKRKAIIGMSILLLCPTVILDGAYWCQCDIIYASFILWSIYFFIKGKSRTCFVFLGIAFSFKLQTLFIVPFYIIMWLKKKNVNPIDFFLIPIMYFILHIPAWICGRPLKELMTIYLDQSGTYNWGTLNYPNAYVLLDETMKSMHYTDAVCSAGTLFTIIVLGFLAYYLYVTDFELTEDVVLLIAMLSISLCVYFLPHMHERYGFLVDLLVVIYTVLKPKRIPLMCIVFFISVNAFAPYLWGTEIIDFRLLATMETVVIVYLGYELYKQICNHALLN